MRRLGERAGDRLAGGLRRLADNFLVFWLGTRWEALVVHTGPGRDAWLLNLLGIGVIACGFVFVQWWGRRQHRQQRSSGEVAG